MIYNLSLFKAEGMDVCVICYGGCGSNTLVDTLEKNGLHCRTHLWDKIFCHCPEPIDTKGIPIIYLYRDPREAFLSMKRRPEIWVINQKKLTNCSDCILSDENLLQAMLCQFSLWSQYAKENTDKVLLVRYEELFQPDIREKLSFFLNIDPVSLVGFPMKYKPPKQYLFTELENPLFQKYKADIEAILFFHSST
jgi:hypothetical protein